MKIRVVTAAALISVGIAFSQSSRAELHSIQLVNAQGGWAANDDQLFRTADAGKTWTEITPPAVRHGSIASVFFLDAVEGWVLVWRVGSDDKSHFHLAHTTDGGANWASAWVDLAGLQPQPRELGTVGNINFMDAQHGWMVLATSGSANFRPGIMLQTSDGGKSWSSPKSQPGIYAQVRFLSLNDGWLTGGPGGHFLYSTHDAAKTWNQISLQPPAKQRGIGDPLYSLPQFSDSKHGAITVRYEATSTDASMLAVFRTQDGGLTWKLDRGVSGMGQQEVGARAAVIDSDLLVASRMNDDIQVTTLSKDGRTKIAHPKTSLPANPQKGKAAIQLSFFDRLSGWLLTTGGLLATSNGGADWIDITPYFNTPGPPVRSGSAQTPQPSDRLKLRFKGDGPPVERGPARSRTPRLSAARSSASTGANALDVLNHH
jgi:photosystem II stability/assembly factor-like uncharacterized protein